MKDNKLSKNIKDVYLLIKRFYPLDHSIVPLILLHSFLGALIPYISILFSPFILDSLLNKDIETSIKCSIVMVVSILIANIIYSLVDNSYSKSSSKLNMKVTELIYLKPLDVDYQTLEEGDNQSKYVSATTSLNFVGTYLDILSALANIFKSFIGVIISIVLVVKLCLSIGNSEGLLNILTSPIISVIVLLGVSFLGGGVVSKITEIYNEKEYALLKEGMAAEKSASYLWRLIAEEENIKIIESYDMKESLDNMIDTAMNKIKPTFQKITHYGMVRVVVGGLSLSSISTVSYILVSLKIMANAITIGSFLQYTQAIVQLNNNFFNIIQSYLIVGKLMIHFKDITEYMDLPNKFETGTIPVEKRKDNEYYFEFENVSFKYPQSKDYILKNVNCKLNLHEKIAIVGENGAGKTTFIKLLARLYEPTEGVIKLNGIDIRKYNYKEYLSLFSVVFQDFRLYGDNVKERVAGSVVFDENKVVDCLRRANLSDDFIFGKKNYQKQEFEINLMFKEEGSSNHSGGEEQKIALARALYKNAPVVILDEPTAALDPISEFEIYESFSNLVEDKTTLYISHRMSSCRFCDDIIVFKEGQIVQRGSHDNLVEKDGLYAKLWNAQAQYYA